MLTLTDLLRRTEQCYGARTAIRDAAGNFTWNAYLARVARTAGLLRQLGLRPGDRFATLSRNSVRHGELLLAGYWAGIIPAPLNYRLAPPEIAAMLEDAACKTIFVDEVFLPFFEQPALVAWKARAIVIGTATDLPTIDALFANAQPIAAHEAREDDDALLLYTGGTTGRGKGVRLTHCNIVANALQLARTMAASEDDIYLHVSPMFHSTDLKATVVTMFGGGHVYLQDATPALILETIARYGVTIASLVPTMIIRILREAQVDRYDLHTLRLVSYGTAPIDEQWLRKAMAAFPAAGFHQCYGLTETSPYLAILDEVAHRHAITDLPDLLRAAGRALPGTGVRIVDDDGRDVRAGGIGEIIVTGPQISKGYLNRPEEQAKTFRDGWLYTGDIGRIDDEGYLHVLDRKKEMVITGGENVYTREVETVLLQHPDIAEAAVLGVPDAQYGEALLAVLVCANGNAVTEDEMIAFCRGHLGGFKIPRQFMYVTHLPRTPLGKVQKHELRRAYLSGATKEHR